MVATSGQNQGILRVFTLVNLRTGRASHCSLAMAKCFFLCVHKVSHSFYGLERPEAHAAQANVVNRFLLFARSIHGCFCISQKHTFQTLRNTFAQCLCVSECMCLCVYAMHTYIRVTSSSFLLFTHYY